MKINDRDAHVCMGKGEVKAGDRVALFRNECTKPLTPQSKGSVASTAQPVCKQIKLGEGRVVRPLNEHYSEIEVDPGVTFQEGAIVEKR